MRRNKDGRLVFDNAQEELNYQKKIFNDMKEASMDTRFPQFEDGTYDIVNFDTTPNNTFTNNSYNKDKEIAALKAKVAKLEKILAGEKK